MRSETVAGPCGAGLTGLLSSYRPGCEGGGSCGVDGQEAEGQCGQAAPVKADAFSWLSPAPVPAGFHSL